MTNSPTLFLTGPQQELLESTARHPAFVAGFGAGKTEALIYAAIGDAAHSSNAVIGIYAPTFSLLGLSIAPRLSAALDRFGVPHKYNKNESVIYTSFPRMGDFILRTMDSPERIVAYETYRSHVDELDTLKADNARLVWNKILGRNRQKPDGIANPHNRVTAYTTPEGFKFVYDRWVTNGGGDYQIIQAPTSSNPMLPDGYIQSLRDSYPASLIEAYLEGKFVNLTSGTVYRNYDRVKHRSTETIREKDVLHIGQDFNVGNMASAVFVQRPNGWHCVGEIAGALDTPELLEIVASRYDGHKLIFYPDASGKSRKTNDASRTDISLIRAAHTVKAKPSNPLVKDRILSVNGAYSKGKLWVNDSEAPTVAAAQEQQAYSKNGEPDKTSGHDHFCFSGDTLVTVNGALTRFDKIPERGTVIGPYGFDVKYIKGGLVRKAQRMLAVTLSNGYTFKCTYDHKVLAISGWVRADELTEGDKLCSQLSYQKQDRTFAELNTTYAENTSSVMGFVCIGKFGKSITGAFRRVSSGISTMLTGMSTITLVPTLCLCPQVTTHHTMLSLAQGKCHKPQSRPRRFGTQVMTAWLGIRRTMKSMVIKCMKRKTRLGACSAENTLKRRETNEIKQCSAQENARQHIGEIPALITKQDIARDAVAISLSANMLQKNTALSVVQVKRCGKLDAYCLTVESCGCFSLGGPIVSNCDALGYLVHWHMPVNKPRIIGL